MKNYHPANGTDTYAHSDNDASGAYIFKPMENDTNKYPYSAFKVVDSFKGDVVNAIVLQYASESISEIYTVIIRMFQHTQVIEFEIKLHGIPISDKKGKEVVANWELLGFDNADVFYTDSNGLEMQKRVLNQRPDWNLVTDEKQSSNYYPIQQAIAIRDTNSTKQMTVMNDRSQGGSVLSSGSIELMHDRRLLFDDWRGVGEALNETNDSGTGIEVNAKYYVQIFDTSKTESVQRRQQLITDEPIQCFYMKGEQELSTPEDSQDDINADLLGAVKNLKLHLLPEKRNQILIRLENMSDLFDGTPESTPYFDLQSYATNLYAKVNRGEASPSIDITERTLTNNQNMVEWQKEKFHWKSQGGDSPVKYPADKADGVVAMQPQRIRLFRVKYDVKETPQSFLQ